MAVETHGAGEAIVMVHGLGGTGNIYGPQCDVLSRHFEVIRPDLPGSGRTPSGGPLSIESLAEAVASLLRPRSAPVHLVGHSMGTIICQHLAVNHPELIRSLLLIGPLAAPTAAARPNIHARAAKARAEGMVGIADTIVQAATSAATKSARPHAAAFVRELLMRQNPEDYARSCEALAGAQAAAVESLRCPVLLITGSDDVVSPPPAVAALAARIPRAQVRIINGCGHWTTIECASEVTEAMLNFYFTQDWL